MHFNIFRKPNCRKKRNFLTFSRKSFWQRLFQELRRYQKVRSKVFFGEILRGHHNTVYFTRPARRSYFQSRIPKKKYMIIEKNLNSGISQRISKFQNCDLNMIFGTIRSSSKSAEIFQKIICRVDFRKFDIWTVNFSEKSQNST